MSSVGCVVVGAGAWGCLVADQILAVDDMELVGMADRSVERSKVEAGARGCRPYESASEVWNDPDVSAVAVAVPNHEHVPIALQALDANKHLLLEKPMALTVHDAERVAERAESSGLVLMMNHIQRYYAPLVALHDLVSAGELGEIQGVAVSRRDRLVRSKSWLQQREMVGGLLFQSACHEFDLLRWLCGDATEIACRATSRVIAPEPLDYPDLIVSQLRFESGAVAQLWTCMTDPLVGYDGVVTGDAGTAWFDLYDARLRWGLLSGETHERTWSPADSWSPHAWTRNGSIAEGEADALQALLKSFRDSVRDGKPPAVSAHDGVMATELAQAGYLSIAEARPVALPLSGSDRLRKTYLELPKSTRRT